jgi:acyl transferase domain-containing protein
MSLVGHRSVSSKFSNGLWVTHHRADELSKPREESNVDDPEFSQTLCTVVQVALVDLLCQFKILPAAVAGHSSGEIVAA